MPTPPAIGLKTLGKLAASLDDRARRDISRAVRTWAQVKRAGGKVLVATGSGPNLHEGVTTLIAELIGQGLVDAVLTSSAVAGHEMAGTLEWVRRIDGRRLGLDPAILPADGKVEAALMPPPAFEAMASQVDLDHDLYRRMLAAPGNRIMKVAGNLAYPSGLWLEKTAQRLLPLAQKKGLPLEAIAGRGMDRLTMLGACAKRNIPCLVTVPQLVGGGQVGVCIGDSVPIGQRSQLVAKALGQADLIIESGVALTQEIHDGPFELFTGHGRWAREMGMETFSLGGTKVVRIDLDPQLRRVWELERSKKAVGQAIDLGKPKAVSMRAPFRMEMSGFARLPGAFPITGDLGRIWPLLAWRTAKALGVKLGFMCYKQGTGPGEAVRKFIVENIRPLDPSRVLEA